MTSLQARLTPFLLALALAAAPPSLGFAQAQGFSSMSTVAPAAPARAATGADKAPADVAVLAANSAPPRVLPVDGIVGSTTAAGSTSPVVAAPVPSSASAGTVVPGIPATSAPVAPVASASRTLSAGSGSFSSVSGGAPSLPASPPASASFGAGSSSSFEMADKVVVVKHERVLRLLRRGRVIAEYPIKLGLNPYGHKQREGDFRTPEGNYDLVARNPRSEFFLSIKISYPNREDAAVAYEAGHAPGGLIMIHGQPNEPKRPTEYYATRDWTDGCIALSNADMVDVWLRTTAGIPIEIRK